MQIDLPEFYLAIESRWVSMLSEQIVEECCVEFALHLEATTLWHTNQVYRTGGRTHWLATPTSACWLSPAR